VLLQASEKVVEVDAPSTPPRDDSTDNAASPAAEEDEKSARSDGKKFGTAAKAFQRVKEEEWLGKKGAWDNSYVGTFGQDGWGYKAQEVLGKVRGKDFRHEKTKKKRGTYKGGKIDNMGSNSIKFESDDEA
jgi:hypothetical protein